MDKFKNFLFFVKSFIDDSHLVQEMKDLQVETDKNGFWLDQEKAIKINQKLSLLNKKINLFHDFERNFNNLLEVSEVLTEEELFKESAELESKMEELKKILFLTGEYDQHNAIITCTVGAGGVDAADWTEMVFKMLFKYCENNSWKVKVFDTQTADIAGLKSISFSVSGGDYIYGQLRSESGVHRLVRPSPFNSKGTRETSFMQVDIVPEFKLNTEIKLNDKDLRVDTFRAQGAGGQHVNTTDSAVRITHLPTGLVVQCQNERSQHQNKEQALTVLYSRLLDLKHKENQEKQGELKQGKMQSSFGGGHIRSYVLDDRYVKDLRTGYKTTKVDDVLNGDLQAFINQYLSEAPEF